MTCVLSLLRRRGNLGPLGLGVASSVVIAPVSAVLCLLPAERNTDFSPLSGPWPAAATLS